MIVLSGLLVFVDSLVFVDLVDLSGLSVFVGLAFVVVFLYGSLLWYVFPIDPEISWEGHLSGFGVGVLFAVLFKENPIENIKYEWEKETYNPDEDPFLQHFDENGNFIETHTKEEEIEESPKITIRYTIKKDSTPRDKQH